MESSIKLLNKASEVLAYKSAHSCDEQQDEIMNIRVNIASMYKVATVQQKTVQH